VSGKESYNVLKVTCSEVFKEINELVAAKSINVKGQEIPLEFFLSGDYKFLLLVLGMNAANSTYACIYCKIPKTDRWDMSKPENHYWEEGMARTLNEMKENACKASANNYGCLYQPLLYIPVENVRIDELHLFLRITDILERNLIHACIEWDTTDGVDPPSGTRIHLSSLVKSICECGVAFSVWQTKNGDQKLSGHYEWSSMVGGDKKKVLANLPRKLDGVLAGKENCQTVTKIWQDFKIVYDTLSEWAPTQEMKSTFFSKATEWARLCLSLGDEESGYGKSRITPYMHILCYHVPHFLKDNNGLKRFTGQGIEKINDIVRTIYHNKSNKHDACLESLQALKRIDRLQSFEREPNKYEKKNNDYWTKDIFEQRRKRLRLGVVPREDSAEIISVDSLSITEVKTKLRVLGVKTKIRRLEKLRELLCSELLKSII